MKTGDLVKWEPDCSLSWIAIILNDREEEDEYGDFVMLIQWVTGTYIGQEDYIPVEDLEVVA